MVPSRAHRLFQDCGLQVSTESLAPWTCPESKAHYVPLAPVSAPIFLFIYFFGDVACGICASLAGEMEQTQEAKAASASPGETQRTKTVGSPARSGSGEEAFGCSSFPSFPSSHLKLQQPCPCFRRAGVSFCTSTTWAQIRPDHQITRAISRGGCCVRPAPWPRFIPGN